MSQDGGNYFFLVEKVTSQKPNVLYMTITAGATYRALSERRMTCEQAGTDNETGWKQLYFLLIEESKIASIPAEIT